MRKDFSLMKEMGTSTHVGTNERYQQLNGFLQDIQRRDEGRKELDKWQIPLDHELVPLKGRTMKSEAIQYKNVIYRDRLFIHLECEFIVILAHHPLQSIGS